MARCVGRAYSLQWVAKLAKLATASSLFWSTHLPAQQQTSIPRQVANKTVFACLTPHQQGAVILHAVQLARRCGLVCVSGGGCTP
jgi:hypothetical protein